MPEENLDNTDKIINFADLTDDELDVIYGQLLKEYRSAIETPNGLKDGIDIVTNHPSRMMMATISEIKEKRKAKVDLTNKLNTLRSRIETGRVSAIIIAIYEVRTQLSILKENLGLDKREEIMQILKELTIEDEELKSAKEDLYNALSGNFESDLPEDFYDEHTIFVNGEHGVTGTAVER